MDKKSDRKVVSYKLSIPDTVYDELKEIAESRNISIAELIRKAIKWTIIFDEIDENKGAVYIKKSEDSEIAEVIMI